MKLLCFLACSAFFVSCATKVVTRPDNVKIISVFTGTKGGEWKVYNAQFASAAKKECPSGYEVIEKSYKPAALKCAHDLLSDGQYFWVVKCTH